MQIIMRLTKFNRNTMAALAGAVERGLPVALGSLIYHSEAMEELSLPTSDMFVFVYSFTTPGSDAAFMEFKYIRSHFKNAVILAGGPHASGDPGSVIDAGADYVVTGEGEAVFTSLLGSLAGGTAPARGIIKGSAVDFSAYPPFPHADPGRALYIELTRGCPYRCSFCQTSSIFGCKPRHRSIESVLSAAGRMLECGLNDLRFVTPNALSYGSGDGLTPAPDKLEMLLKELRRLCLARNGRIFLGSFPSEIRPEFFTSELMNMLKKYVSNDNVIIGAQSGSDSVLEAAGRLHGTQLIFKAVKTALESGFKVNVDFLFGFDEESDDKEAMKSVDLMEKLLQTGARIHSHKLLPVAGTKYYDSSRIITINPLILNFLHKNHGKGIVYGNF